MINKKWLFRLIGITILIYILFKIDFREYVRYLDQIHIPELVYACLLILFIYFVKAFRWKLLLRSQNIKYSYRDTFLAFTSSNFIAFITPGRLGEFAKVFYLKNDQDIPVSRSISSVITDRLFDVYILLCFGMFGVIKIGMGSNFLFYIFLLICLFLPFLFFHKGILNYWVNLLVRLPLISKIALRKNESIQQFKEGFQQLLNIRLLYAAVLTLISYIVLYIAAWFIADSMQIELSFVSIILMVSVANILSFLPITISGLGTREAVFIYFFSNIQYSAEQALVYSTLFFFCFYIIGGLYAYICYMIKPVSLSRIKQETQ